MSETYVPIPVRITVARESYAEAQKLVEAWATASDVMSVRDVSAVDVRVSEWMPAGRAVVLDAQGRLWLLNTDTGKAWDMTSEADLGG